MQPQMQPGSGFRSPLTINQFSLSQQRVLRNTYLLLALTMVPTVIGAFLGVATAQVVFLHPLMFSLIMLAGVIGLQFAIVANRNSGLGAALLLLMTFVLGWWLGPMLSIALRLSNGVALIALAAGGTAGILLLMSAIATTSKRDFSFMGKFLMVGMYVLLFASLANMFFHLPALALTISVLVVAVFSLFLLHDVSRIVNGGEDNYIVAATGVYMSLFNIFVNLLNILMMVAGGNDRR